MTDKDTLEEINRKVDELKQDVNDIQEKHKYNGNIKQRKKF